MKKLFLIAVFLCCKNLYSQEKNAAENKKVLEKYAGVEALPAQPAQDENTKSINRKEAAKPADPALMVETPEHARKKRPSAQAQKPKE